MRVIFRFGAIKLSELQNKALRGRSARDPLQKGDQLEIAKMEASLERLEKSKAESKAAVSDFLRQVPSTQGRSIRELQGAISPRLWRCRTCSKFFLAPDQKLRVYCSRRCATKSTAGAAVRQGRNRTQARKLIRARAAVKRCPPNHEDWKAWVSFRASVTRNWLTYAVARGELKVPKVKNGN